MSAGRYQRVQEAAVGCWSASDCAKASAAIGGTDSESVVILKEHL